MLATTRATLFWSTQRLLRRPTSSTFSKVWALFESDEPDYELVPSLRKGFFHASGHINDPLSLVSPLSMRKSSPVADLLITVRKYIHSAISPAVAHFFKGVRSIISFQSTSSSMTGLFSFVITPPGEMELQVPPNKAMRLATFLI